MNAIDSTVSIASNPNLANVGLKFCLMNINKMPLKTDGTLAKPNNVEDFVGIEDLLKSPMLALSAGVGISVQGSNITAIDIDKCFSSPFDLSTGDDRFWDILNIFKDTYSEFSFSGKGARILLRTTPVENYEENYYIKNSNNQIEYYHPSGSYRYVSLTGKSIINKPIKEMPLEGSVLNFLSKYMVRPKPLKRAPENAPQRDDRDIEELWKKVVSCYLTDYNFQSVILNEPPGKLENPQAGQSESEKDFYIICYLYDHVTQDKEKLKSLFERTYYFKKKDYEHLRKWNNGYYFDFQFNNASRR